MKNMEKYNNVLKEFLDIIPLENKIFYEELANKAIILGYVPTRDKTKCISISFRNNKSKYTIMKFAEETLNGFQFKFSANKNYSKIFEESIKERNKIIRKKYAEKYNIKTNVTCFRCVNCGNVKKLFYSIRLDNGEKYILCGSWIHINSISKEIVDEAGKMMKIQHEKICEE